MGKKKDMRAALSGIDPADRDHGDLRVVIETPKGSRNKYKFDEEIGAFTLSGVLPVGAAFPFDFGYIPSTIGEDGDPLDVLVLMDEPAFPGCVLDIRLIGVIEACQSEGEETAKNDRLIGVAAKSRTHRDVRRLNDLSAELIEEIEHFFVSYNQVKGRTFEPTGRSGPERACELIDAGITRASGGRKNGAAKKGTKGSKGHGRKRKQAGGKKTTASHG